MLVWSGVFEEGPILFCSERIHIFFMGLYLFLKMISTQFKKTIPEYFIHIMIILSEGADSENQH